MSSQKSQNLNLHLWEPQDNFLRTEFNENFTAIDSAVIAHRRELMNALSYNIHRLTAQRDFNAGFQGASRNLFVNPFSGVSHRAGITGFQWDGYSGVMLGPQAQITTEEFISCVSDFIQGVPSSNTIASFRASMDEKPARLTSVVLYISISIKNEGLEYMDVTSSLYRMDGKKKTLVKTATVNLGFPGNSSGSVIRHADLPLDFLLEAGNQYLVEISTYHPDVVVYYVNRTEFPHYATFSAAVGDVVAYKGTATDTAVWEGPVHQAVGLVRYQNGSITLSVNGKPMTRRVTRTVTNCAGEACTEAEFVLDHPGTGNMTFALTAQCSTNSNMKVFDYGVYALN